MKYLDKKHGAMWEFKLENFEQLRDFVENEIHGIDDYIFRGQAKAEWNLTSTLDRLIRHARLTGAKRETIKQFVRKHLNRFKLEIRGRRGDNPPKLQENELWALGQHYGLATPLLDWSQSPYIALFFALTEIKNNGSKRSLWCLNRRQLDIINEPLCNRHSLPGDWLELIFPDCDDNKRLIGQSGLFSKGPVMKHVDEWICDQARTSENPTLLKVVFPGSREFRKSALKKLQMMNITHSTLFFLILLAQVYSVISLLKTMKHNLSASSDSVPPSQSRSLLLQ